MVKEKYRKIIIESIKLVFAIFIVWWIYKSGNLDFALVIHSMKKHTDRWVLAIIANLLGLLVMVWRWRVLLTSLRPQEKYDLGFLYNLGWIACFFNAYLPGGVAGDFVKAGHMKSKYDYPLKPLIASMVVDRIYWTIGLLGNFVLLGPFISNQSFILNMWWVCFILSSIMLINHLVAPAEVKWMKKFGHLSEIWTEIQSQKKNVFKLSLLSVLAQALVNLSFWIVANQEGQPFVLPFSLSMGIFPLGQLSTVIPITPSGVGVAHAAFQELFKLEGITNGASVYNLYFTMNMFICFLGLIPFVLMRKKNRVNPEQKT